MKVFYIDIDEFKKNHKKDFLLPYNDKNFKTEKRFYEYTTGRYLIKNAAKKYYDIKNTEIITNEKGKPYFKNNEIYFSISHSNNIVIACFDKTPCGIDLEFIKKRDLIKLSKHYNVEFKTLDDFYKFWTIKEAEYKLNQKAKTIYTKQFKNFFLTIASDRIFNEDIEILNFD